MWRVRIVMRVSELRDAKRNWSALYATAQQGELATGRLAAHFSGKSVMIHRIPAPASSAPNPHIDRVSHPKGARSRPEKLQAGENETSMKPSQNKQRIRRNSDNFTP